MSVFCPFKVEFNLSSESGLLQNNSDKNSTHQRAYFFPKTWLLSWIIVNPFILSSGSSSLLSPQPTGIDFFFSAAEDKVHHLKLWICHFIPCLINNGFKYIGRAEWGSSSWLWPGKAPTVGATGQQTSVWKRALSLSLLSLYPWN